MTLVDTSVWIDHLRHGDAGLMDALQAGQVGMHPFVVGELACGSLRARAEVLGLLQALPPVPVATDKEVLFFMDEQALMGRGIGYVDMHLLASTRLGGALLWTRDKRLHAIATELGLAHSEKQH
ncbi:type II toxin-antitoxin system VapC family toxin [Acidovorax soli]|uniref:type II toxin-antitoxin system VapC family toxin n=1 Tax=Acidovorax soli TaxID=592050 RepID=UPI0032B26352